MRCADGTSRNNNRLDGISLTFEVLADGLDDVLLVEFVNVVTLSKERTCPPHFNLTAGLYHRDDASNVFTKDISGTNLSYCSKHLRPEVTVILRAVSLSGM